jgi:hypothetical protein
MPRSLCCLETELEYSDAFDIEGLLAYTGQKLASDR